MLRDWCVPSALWVTFWLCVALLRDLSLRLVMVTLLLGNSCLPQFGLSCTPAGYTGSYSSHSFCIGAATTAGARGVPDHLIKILGRWSSDAHQIYIRTPVSSIVQVSRQLVA